MDMPNWMRESPHGLNPTLRATEESREQARWPRLWKSTSVGCQMATQPNTGLSYRLNRLAIVSNLCIYEYIYVCVVEFCNSGFSLCVLHFYVCLYVNLCTCECSFSQRPEESIRSPKHEIIDKL